jgi:hypothetical protein
MDRLGGRESLLVRSEEKLRRSEDMLRVYADSTGPRDTRPVNRKPGRTRATDHPTFSIAPGRANFLIEQFVQDISQVLECFA